MARVTRRMVRFLAALEMTGGPPLLGMARVTRRMVRFLAALEMTGGPPDLVHWRRPSSTINVGVTLIDVWNRDRSAPL
jgi:hypothetical protein